MELGGRGKRERKRGGRIRNEGDSREAQRDRRTNANIQLTGSVDRELSRKFQIGGMGSFPELNVGDHSQNA